MKTRKDMNRSGYKMPSVEKKNDESFLDGNSTGIFFLERFGIGYVLKELNIFFPQKVFIFFTKQLNRLNITGMTS